MTRIKIKCRGNTNRERKIKLLEILCSKGIHVTKVFTSNDGFVILTLNEEHAENVFTTEIITQLDSNGFTATMPPDLKVKKKVL